MKPGSHGGKLQFTAEPVVLSKEREIWRSPMFAVIPHRWLRVTFRVRGHGRGYLTLVGANPEATWGRELNSSHGSLVASDFSEMEGAPEWRAVVWYSRVLPHATHGMIRLENGGGSFEVCELGVDEVDSTEVAGWVEDSMRAIPLLPRKSSWSIRPKNLPCATRGNSLRVLVLGDSAMCDLGHAPFAPLWERSHPGSRMEVHYATGASTGPGDWLDPQRCPEKDLSWNESVAAVAPDIIFLGGISTNGDWAGLEALVNRIGTTIKNQSGEISPVVLVTPLPLLPDSKAMLDHPQIDHTLKLEQDRETVIALARKLGTGLLDLTEYWRQQILASRNQNSSPECWYRDPWHVSTKGRMLQARCIVDFLQEPDWLSRLIDGMRSRTRE